MVVVDTPAREARALQHPQHRSQAQRPGSSQPYTLRQRGSAGWSSARGSLDTAAARPSSSAPTSPALPPHQPSRRSSLGPPGTPALMQRMVLAPGTTSRLRPAPTPAVIPMPTVLSPTDIPQPSGAVPASAPAIFQQQSGFAEGGGTEHVGSISMGRDQSCAGGSAAGVGSAAPASPARGSHSYLASPMVLGQDARVCWPAGTTEAAAVEAAYSAADSMWGQAPAGQLSQQPAADGPACQVSYKAEEEEEGEGQGEADEPRDAPSPGGMWSLLMGRRTSLGSNVRSRGPSDSQAVAEAATVSDFWSPRRCREAREARAGSATAPAAVLMLRFSSGSGTSLSPLPSTRPWTPAAEEPLPVLPTLLPVVSSLQYTPHQQHMPGSTPTRLGVATPATATPPPRALATPTAVPLLTVNDCSDGMHAASPPLHTLTSMSERSPEHSPRAGQGRDEQLAQQRQQRPACCEIEPYTEPPATSPHHQPLNQLSPRRSAPAVAAAFDGPPAAGYSRFAWAAASGLGAAANNYGSLRESPRSRAVPGAALRSEASMQRITRAASLSEARSRHSSGSGGLLVALCSPFMRMLGGGSPRWSLVRRQPGRTLRCCLTPALLVASVRPLHVTNQWHTHLE